LLINNKEKPPSPYFVADASIIILIKYCKDRPNHRPRELCRQLPIENRQNHCLIVFQIKTSFGSLTEI
jgi:hypothetical protein